MKEIFKIILIITALLPIMALGADNDNVNIVSGLTGFTQNLTQSVIGGLGKATNGSLAAEEKTCGTQADGTYKLCFAFPGTADTTAKTFPEYVSIIIKYAFILASGLAVFMLFKSAFLWITNGGSVERVEKARSILINVASGVVTLFLAPAVIYLIDPNILILGQSLKFFNSFNANKVPPPQYKINTNTKELNNSNIKQEFKTLDSVIRADRYEDSFTDRLARSEWLGVPLFPGAYTASEIYKNFIKSPDTYKDFSNLNDKQAILFQYDLIKEKGKISQYNIPMEEKNKLKRLVDGALNSLSADKPIVQYNNLLVEKSLLKNKYNINNSNDKLLYEKAILEVDGKINILKNVFPNNDFQELTVNQDGGQNNYNSQDISDRELRTLIFQRDYHQQRILELKTKLQDQEFVEDEELINELSTYTSDLQGINNDILKIKGQYTDSIDINTIPFEE